MVRSVVCPYTRTLLATLLVSWSIFVCVVLTSQIIDHGSHRIRSQVLLMCMYVVTLHCPENQCAGLADEHAGPLLPVMWHGFLLRPQ